MYGLGERLSCDGGRRGTVRFVGALDDKPVDVIWVGIEWDNAEDGKHDGTVGARRYFTCRDGGKASFIKLDKLNAESKVSFDEAYQARSGARLRVPVYRSFLTELISRYIDAARREETVIIHDGVGRGASKKNIEVFAKQQPALDARTHAVLREERIASAGEPGRIAALCPELVEVDLSNNLLSDFGAVCDIARQLRRLESLNISGNRLQMTEPVGRPFDTLQILVMSRIGLGWADVQRLEPLLPCLKELHLVDNNVESAEP